MITQHEKLEAIMPQPLCPHCGTTQYLDRETYENYEGPVTCGYCKGRYYIEFGGTKGLTLKSPVRPLGDPELLKGLTVPSIPKSLYRLYEKATLSLASGIPEGAAFLCRYIIQQALLLQGIPDQPPQTMVNIAHSKEILSDTAYSQCSAAVFMGGKAGHPQSNWADNIGSDDAKQALLLTKRVLLELFYPGGLPS